MEQMYEIYILSYHKQVVESISQPITHVVMQNNYINSEIQAEAVEKSQGVIINIEWLDSCLRMKKLIDQTPYIIDRGKNTNIIKEKKYYCSWSNNLRKTMYIICKNISQFQQSLLSVLIVYFIIIRNIIYIFRQ